MKDTWHDLMHILGWWSGTIVSRFDDDDNLWMGLQCCKCGRVGNSFKTDY